MSSDEENQKPAKNNESSSEQCGRFDCKFIKKPSGFLMFINMFLAFVSMCMMSGWLGDVRYRSGRWNFFMYACTHTWVALLIMIILRLLKVPSCCAIINWHLTYAINAGIFIVLLLISSAVVAKKAGDYGGIYCDALDCDLLAATACFGFITMIGCMVECFFHVRDWQASSQDN
ncbi:uncharacterized protein LOC130614502 [Hydractinia symbiolongicarpus]|uniref:uncharacterized protein LOC130614502 n=1 Tax=Hydractinia symbiolongicarpus TaxID=13093 RepID=UPI00254DEF12|nr:uncharacterized protein LOC130614502 [Hydractinia symbiolongicarpus]